MRDSKRPRRFRTISSAVALALVAGVFVGLTAQQALAAECLGMSMNNVTASEGNSA